MPSNGCIELPGGWLISGIGLSKARLAGGKDVAVLELPGYERGVGPWSTPSRRGGPHGARVAPEERCRVVDRLLGLRAVGDLSHAHVTQVARRLGVSERSVYRWLAQGRDVPARRQRGYRLSETDWIAYEDFRGNVAGVHRARAAVVAGESTAAGVPIADHLVTGWAGAEPVALRTLQVAFRRECSPAERAYWMEGEKARRDRRVYGQRIAAHRNALWQADHTQLDIVVLPPRGKPLRPWLTTFIDVATRLIMGWAIALTRDTGSVLSALRSAVVRDGDLGGFGGIPAVIECDHGAEFVASVIQRCCDGLGVRVQPVEVYEGRGKGVIERWHGTISTMLLTQLPGYTGGPRDKRGRLYGPVRDDAAWRAALLAPQPSGHESMVALPITAFTRVFASWAHWFNTEHVHQGIGGCVPLQVWRADPTPIREVATEDLRDLLLTQRDATITSHGIRLRNLHYRAPEIQGMVGEKVIIRYAPHDDRFLEVYTADGRHLGTATPVDAHTAADAEAYRQSWAQETRRLTARRRSANQRIRRRIAPLTHQHLTTNPPATPQMPGAGETAPVETRLIPTTAPQPPRSRPRGSVSLLGLRETTALTEFEPLPESESR